jgi:hypothetical protein
MPNMHQAAVLAPAAAHPQPRRQRTAGKRSGGSRLVSFLFALIVVGGLVAAGVVFGRPYLFPDQWDTAVKPYAQAVEGALGAEFVEPVTVTAEASVEYEARRSAQLLGDWQTELPVWRALALANGQVDQPNIDLLLEGWSPAMYSYDDGQIYHDASLTGVELDAQLTFVMTQAAIDQRENWSARQQIQGLDAAALTQAHVLQQSLAAQRSTEFGAKIVQPDLTPLVFLPPVLGYRVVAPTMFAELLPTPDIAVGGINPLSAAAGPGLLTTEVLAPSSAPVLTEGEVLVGDSVAQDRSFWYLTFASYLDAPQAYAASQSIVENSLSVTDRSGRTCAVSTFSGGDVDQTAILGSTLAAWTAAAPPELGASTSVLADGTLQFASCDPGVGFENGARFGAARELIGYRLGATATAVAFDGSSPADVAAALLRYEQSEVGTQLATLPFDATAADAAAAAQTAIAVIVEVPPTVEPAGG